MKTFAAITFLLASSLLGQSQPPQKHPFTFEDMMKLKRVGAPVPSPDGKWVVFDCQDVDLAANTKVSHLWVVPASGGESRRLNPTPNHEERPRFSPDGKRLIWTSKATDPTQIWMCDFDPQAWQLLGKPHQVTSISTGADGAIWSPDGKNIVFVSAVYPDCKDEACNKQRDEELKKSKVKAKIFSRLFYRHWNAFTEFKRSHLFVIDANAGADAVESAVPSGQNTDALRTAHATASPKKISTSPGADTTPLYSPDGKMIAWRSQARARFEADKWRLLVQDRESGKTRDLTEKFERSVGSFTWDQFPVGGTAILFTAEDHGESPMFAAFPAEENPIPQHQGTPSQKLHVDDLVFAGRSLFFT